MRLYDPTNSYEAYISSANALYGSLKTSTGLEGTKLTDGTETVAISTADSMLVTPVSSAGASLYTTSIISTVKITDGTEIVAVSTADHLGVDIAGFPTAGIAVKNPLGTPLQVDINDGGNSASLQVSNSTSIGMTTYGLVVINLNYVWSSGSSSWTPMHQST